jgi:hypothetical protein
MRSRTPAWQTDNQHTINKIKAEHDSYIAKLKKKHSNQIAKLKSDITRRVTFHMPPDTLINQTTSMPLIILKPAPQPKDMATLAPKAEAEALSEALKRKRGKPRKTTNENAEALKLKQRSNKNKY